MRRRLVAAMLALGATLVLSGCVVFMVAPTATQNAVLGAVHVTIHACASKTSGSPPSGSCPQDGNSGEDATVSSQPNNTQILVGFRLPAGASHPAGFSSSSTGPNNTGPQLNFTPSTSYTSELQRLDPIPGMQWVGYISQLITYSSASGKEQNFTASLDFGLPAGANGRPFPGPFAYRPVVGARKWTNTSTTPDASLPVQCNSSSTTTFSFGPADWENQCVDDPGSTNVDSNFDAPTRDAGIITGQSVTAPAGSASVFPFEFDYAGTATPGANFSFSSSSSTPGAPTSVSPTSLAPADNSRNTVNVTVAIPRATPPGTYAVNLTARLADGESRTGTGQLTVTAPVHAGPCRVPNLKGLTATRASTELSFAHCKLGKVTHRHARGAPGRVISQSPPLGTTGASGTKVSIVLSGSAKHKKHGKKRHRKR